MNIARLLLMFIAFLSVCGSAVSRALIQEDDKVYKRGKRSRSADHTITEKQSREKEELKRKWYLAQTLKFIDTSGESPGEAPFGSGITTTSAPKVSSPQDGKAARHHHKRRKGKKHKGKKNKKGKKRRNRKHKKHRKHRKHRRTRAAEDVLALLESEKGEDMLEAIASVLSPDDDFNESFEDLEDFVHESAKKCKCSEHEEIAQ